jgi:hypothetical protein
MTGRPVHSPIAGCVVIRETGEPSPAVAFAHALPGLIRDALACAAGVALVIFSLCLLAGGML